MHFKLFSILKGATFKEKNMLPNLGSIFFLLIVDPFKTWFFSKLQHTLPFKSWFTDTDTNILRVCVH